MEETRGQELEVSVSALLEVVGESEDERGDLPGKGTARAKVWQERIAVEASGAPCGMNGTREEQTGRAGVLVLGFHCGSVWGS